MEQKISVILKIMEGEGYLPEKSDALLKRVKKDTHGKADWLKVLTYMEEKGLIVRNRNGKYGLPHQLGFSTGTLQIHPKGFGFMIPDKEKVDIYIEKDRVRGAMHNDRVLVKLVGKDPMERRPEGEIAKVLQRANEKVVGTFEKTNNYGFVIPDNPKILDHILIPAPHCSGAKQGEKVLVQITEWPEEHRLPEGKVLEVLGMTGEEEVERTAVLLKYGIKEKFPAPVVNEAEQMRQLAKEYGQREDLRNLFTVTIDGEDAKDLDDAVSLEKLTEGGWRLGVHIADVSHYVRTDTPIDQEARTRGTSVYLVNHVVPMLPEQLSNNLCSLNAGEDKLTMSVMMDLDKQGNLKKYDIFPSICRIDQRCTYTFVSETLASESKNGQEGKLWNLLKELDDISDILRQKRFDAGGIDFDLPETKVIVDESGKPLDIRREVRLSSHKIIEECMLMANRVVANHLKENKIPGIFRIHEPPNPDAYAELDTLLKGFGYSLKGKRSQSVQVIQKILEDSYQRKDGPVVRRAILQAMERARYSAVSAGHFGLGFKNYLHFTSPIRRYPDLIVHRMLKLQQQQDHLKGGYDRWQNEMSTIADECSTTERAAAEAENEWLDRKKAEFMKEHVGSKYLGIISGITGFGMFVELKNTCEGLVHISNMDDDYYVYSEQSMSLKGQNNRREYKIGDEVRVQVTKVDVGNRQIDFALT